MMQLFGPCLAFVLNEFQLERLVFVGTSLGREPQFFDNNLELAHSLVGILKLFCELLDTARLELNIVARRPLLLFSALHE